MVNVLVLRPEKSLNMHLFIILKKQCCQNPGPIYKHFVPFFYKNNNEKKKTYKKKLNPFNTKCPDHKGKTSKSSVVHGLI